MSPLPRHCSGHLAYLPSPCLPHAAHLPQHAIQIDGGRVARGTPADVANHLLRGAAAPTCLRFDGRLRSLHPHYRYCTLPASYMGGGKLCLAVVTFLHSRCAGDVPLRLSTSLSA